MGILVTWYGFWASNGLEICLANILASRSVRRQCYIIDRQSFISSTASSCEADWPLFSKTSITFSTGCWLTSNRWHWKSNSNCYLVSKYGLNLTVGRSPAIAKHLTRLCSSAHKKAPKDTKITTFLQIVPEPVNTLNRFYIVVNIHQKTYRSWLKEGKIYGLSTFLDLPFWLSSSKTDGQSLWKRFENRRDSHDFKT